jgi:LPS export ABC transporter permease LptG/LPS export ABC transporter permease LptF
VWFDVQILDRYLLREIVPPFLIALGVFTFLLGIKPMLDYAQEFLAKGVDLPTVGVLLMYLLPQALGVALPMAFLTGLLMGLGRLSGDRESVAFLACGVSPLRLLRPVLLLALLAGAADLYTLVRLVPDSNLRFREETFRIMVQQGESDIKPGLFYEGFPGKVLYIREANPAGGWAGVFLADTSIPGRPTVTLAKAGYLEINESRRQVAIVLPGDSTTYVPGDEVGVYSVSRNSNARVEVPADAVFGTGSLGVSRGRPEMRIADLRRAEAEKTAAGISPHPEIIQRHQMFSFPVACLVLALVGVALGLHTRKEGKLGGFTLGLGVIFVYYGLMTMFEALTKGGNFPAEWARWVPNIVVGLIGIAALHWRSRAAGGEITFELPAWPWRTAKAVTGRANASTDRPQPDRVVVVIRIPEIRLPIPRPRVLDLYVARRYLSVSLLSFVGFIGIYYIGTLIDKSERYTKGEATGTQLLEYLFYSTPQFIAYVVPLATLVAALAAVGGLTRTGELVVMRACGISLYRAAAPILMLALVWSGGLFLLDDRVLAHTNRRAEVLDDLIRGNEPHTVNVIASAHWLADKKGRLYYYSAFDIPRQTLHGLSVFDISPQEFRLLSHTLAPQVTFRDGVWQAGADRGWIQRFPTAETATREQLGDVSMDLAAPERFSGMHNDEAALMTFTELRRHIEEQSDSGFRVSAARVQLQARLAFPTVTIVMALIGVPFGVTLGRRGALYGIGFAMILGCAYWLVNTFFVAAGQAEILPAALAAWAANLLFLAVAVYATLSVRT